MHVLKWKPDGSRWTAWSSVFTADGRVHSVTQQTMKDWFDCILCQVGYKKNLVPSVPFWYRLIWVVPDKGSLNGRVCVCVFRIQKKQLCTVSVTYCVSVCRWWMAKIAVRSAEVIYHEVLSIQSQSAPGAWIQDRSVSSFVTLFCFLSSVALLRSFAFYCVIMSFISNLWHQFFSKPETVHQLLLIHVCVSWCCPIFPLPANVNVFWNSVICRWFYFFCC